VDEGSQCGWLAMKTPHVVLAKMFVVAGIMLGMVCCAGCSHGEGRRSRAKIDISTIERALATFYRNYKHFPHSLQDLTERQPDSSPALLLNWHLWDPWNQPYQFDPCQLHPETGAPLIWSDGEPGQPDTMITNWDREPQPRSAAGEQNGRNS
jgi:hypothetical protein